MTPGTILSFISGQSSGVGITAITTNDHNYFTVQIKPGLGI
jgi:hypothetical protein